MKISLALPLLHILANMKPVVGSNSLLCCIGVVTIHVRPSKGMNNAPLAMNALYLMRT